MRKLFAFGLVMALGGWACVPMDGNGNGTPTPTPTASPTPTPDPCEGVTCDEGEECVDGECVPVAADCTTLTGDAANGETFYTANGCADCHGADATGPPSLVDSTCQDHFDKLSGAAPHVGGTSDVTEQDAADLVAFIDSLQ